MGKWFWKLDRGIPVKYMHITATGFEEHYEFQKQCLGRRLENFSHTNLMHTIEDYLLPLSSSYLVMAAFEIFH